jgi:hypothetical protein
MATSECAVLADGAASSASRHGLDPSVRYFNRRADYTIRQWRGTSHVDASGADQVVQLIQELGSVADVLIEVEHSGRGALLIGLDGSRATIDLDSLEGVYQYSRRNAPLRGGVPPKR